MLRIGICDDETGVRQEIYELVSKVLFKYTELDFYYYRNGQDVISSIENREFRAELLLLDIHMPNRDGVFVADYIRKNSIDVDIIFITVSNQHVFQGYKYKAFAYCVKPVAQSQLDSVLVRYMEEKKRTPYCINVSINGQDMRIALNRVIYFESQKRKIIAHMIGDDISFYGKMNDLEAVLPNERFFRCHQSYIVNRDMIDSVRRTEIVVSGMMIPMSRKYYESMNRVEEEAESDITVTKSIALNIEEKGAIVFVSGKLIGTIIRMKDEQAVTIGRDASKVNVLIDTDTVSRVHCTITYHSISNTYSIYDMSKNGVFTAKGMRIEPNKEVRLNAGDELWIGNEMNRVRLG